jgi:hypothetical protein
MFFAALIVCGNLKAIDEIPFLGSTLAVCPKSRYG